MSKKPNQIRSEEKTNKYKTWPLTKNPQFLSNPYEIWLKDCLMRWSFPPSFMRIGQKLWISIVVKSGPFTGGLPYLRQPSIHRSPLRF